MNDVAEAGTADEPPKGGERRARTADQGMRQDLGCNHLAQFLAQRRIELLQEIGEPAAQMAATAVDDRGDRLRDHRDRHAQSQQHDGQANDDVEGFQHVYLTSGRD